MFKTVAYTSDHNSPGLPLWWNCKQTRKPGIVFKLLSSTRMKLVSPSAVETSVTKCCYILIMSTNKKSNISREVLPSEQIAKLKDAFEIMDHDNDGIISKRDLESLKQTTGKTLSQEEITNLLSYIDNGNDNLNFSTFLSIMSNDLSQLPNKSEILRALKVFSTDTEVSAEELNKNLSAIGMNESEFKDVIDRFKSERMNGDQVFMGTDFLNFVSN